MKDILTISRGYHKDINGKEIPVTRIIRRQANKYSKDYQEHKQHMEKVVESNG